MTTGKHLPTNHVYFVIISLFWAILLFTLMHLNAVWLVKMDTTVNIGHM